MKFKNYLDSHNVIVFDLDGTIIDDNHLLIDGLEEGIQLFDNTRHTLIIATGRISATIKQLDLPPTFLNRFEKQILCYDGNALFNSKDQTMQFLNHIPYTLFLQWYKKYFSHFEVVIDVDGILYANSKSAAMQFSMLYKISRKEICICDFASFIGRHLMLIIIFTERELLFEKENTMYSLFDINFNEKHLPRMKITPISCKAIGLEYMLNMKGAHLNDVIAFGNDINDITLIQKADIGIAVQHSDPLLIEVADIALTMPLGELFRM